MDRLDEPDEQGRGSVLTIDLPRRLRAQPAAGHFALAAFELLDREAPTYALDMVSIIESILDDPCQILFAQPTRPAARRSGG